MITEGLRRFERIRPAIVLAPGKAASELLDKSRVYSFANECQRFVNRMLPCMNTRYASNNFLEMCLHHPLTNLGALLSLSKHASDDRPYT